MTLSNFCGEHFQKPCITTSFLKGLAAGMIPYYYGYMVKLITENTTQLGYNERNRMEESSSQWDAFPLFFVLCKEISGEVPRGEHEY